MGWSQGMPRRSHHTTDLMQQVYQGDMQRLPLREGGQGRDREADKQTERNTWRQRVDCDGQDLSRAQVSHLVAGDDMAAGAKLLKADWGNPDS